MMFCYVVFDGVDVVYDVIVVFCSVVLCSVVWMG